MRYISLLVIIISLSGCMDISTSTVYNRSLTSSNSESNPIPLSFSESKGNVFYFILMSSSDDGNPHDLLKVRWINHNKNIMQFNGMKSSLKFSINKEKIITLTPIKDPVLKGYDMNNDTCEEEAVYRISRAQIEELAYAKNVEVELAGRYKVIFAKFNQWHSFRGFKNFIKNS